MKKLLVLLFISLSSCGYQTLYTGDNKDGFIFKDITTIGNKNINKKIISTLNLQKNKSNEKLNKIILESSKNIDEISKDKKGRTSSYRTILNVNLKIIDEGNLVKEKTFKEDFSYNNMDNKFDLKIYQNDVENNLTKKIVDQIIIFLKL